MPPEDKKEILQAITDLKQLVENTAASTANSFSDVHQDISELKTEMSELRTEVKEDIAKLDSKLSHLQNRLDVNAGLDRRVEKLTIDMTLVKEKVGIAS